jgi:hypothetical protein
MVSPDFKYDDTQHFTYLYDLCFLETILVKTRNI